MVISGQARKSRPAVRQVKIRLSRLSVTHGTKNLSLAILMLVALEGACVLSRGKYATLWEESKGPVPDKFAYLCFPANNRVPLLGEDMKPTGRYLTRALMCNERELHQKEAIRIWEGKQEFRIDKTLLTTNPNLPDRDNLIAAWKAAVKSWEEETDWNIVGASFETGPGGTTKITLTRKTRTGVEEQFHYLYSDGVHAQKWLADKAAGLAG